MKGEEMLFPDLARILSRKSEDSAFVFASLGVLEKLRGGCRVKKDYGMLQAPQSVRMCMGVCYLGSAQSSDFGVCSLYHRFGVCDVSGKEK